LLQPAKLSPVKGEVHLPQRLLRGLPNVITFLAHHDYISFLNEGLSPDRDEGFLK
jgi:hypothetical protein